MWRWLTAAGVAVAAGIGLVLAVMAEASPPAPGSISVAARLANFPTRDLPLDRPVELRWNDHHVPYIIADTDHDLAVTLGLVHAHLRLGQLTLAKRIVQGRLSEMAGPFANDIDHALRILDLPRAAATAQANLAPETRAWMEAFVRGLNVYQERMETTPPEFSLLGLTPEPWSVSDLLAIGRLAGLDINWGLFAGYLAEDTPEGRAAFLERIQTASGGGLADAGDPGPAARAFLALVEGFARTGSNAYALAPGRTANGAAWLAADPHLGVSLPNLWLLVGAHSPSYQMTGLMPPGLPFIAVGRNRDVAWGGTNMRAASSDLVDVSGLDPHLIETRDLVIGTRAWFDERRQARWSPHGPVITDAAAFATERGEMLALRWMGHEPMDEVSALLRAAQARDVSEFRAAFARFAVSGQNMVAADTSGNIAHVLAVALPARPAVRQQTLIRTPEEAARHWTDIHDATRLPWTLNPPEGFIASANNWPMRAPVLLGFAFSDDDRVNRLREMLAGASGAGFDLMRDIQTDTRSPKAQALAQALAARARGLDLAGEADAVITALAGWDGDYRADAAVPVMFEALLAHVVPAVGTAKGGPQRAVDRGWSGITRFLLADFDGLDADTQRQILTEGLAAAAEASAAHPTWGDMHRLNIGHALAALPVLGRSYRITDLPSGGSRETPMKAAHGLVSDRHAVSFGSQSRFIADLGDPDGAWALLLGGQDGWLGSDTFADQVPLWRERRYLHLPLQLPAVRAAFPQAMTLSPEP